MRKDHRIYVAGHSGMVGAAIVTLLEERGFDNMLLRTKVELDLLDSRAVADFFAAERPEVVILAAAKVGGINANSLYPADFLYENLMIQNNVIQSSYLQGVEKLCFLGSSCIYPREAPQPIKEESLLTGPLEPTNEGYAIAKIAGYKLAYYHTKQHGMNTISLMPCNLYGKNDDFNLESCHVLSALTKRFVDAVETGAPSVTVWGTGSAR
ncbi:MAG: NAD-dependent epimerase/dehydratase family protein, partial [Kiritimatiellaeota bacterium]|nr:NAD-dependent epimerase/dehydratase family protein [Kiritimatiellota bacterium]